MYSLQRIRLQKKNTSHDNSGSVIGFSTTESYFNQIILVSHQRNGKQNLKLQ